MFNSRMVRFKMDSGSTNELNCPWTTFSIAFRKFSKEFIRELLFYTWSAKRVEMLAKVCSNCEYVLLTRIMSLVIGSLLV